MKQIISTEKQLNQLLEGLRKAKGLGQGAVAEKIGISQERYSVLERHSGRITVDRLLLLLGAMGLEMVIQDKASASDTRSKKPEW